MGLIYMLIVGLIAGWLAGKIMKGSGYGVVGDIVVGIVGALIGGNVLAWFGILTFGLIGSIFSAVVGAVLLIFIIRLIKRV
jgi:uncharacterized membrane protein YeaQ/YmgE (transglycosylase-associated protein family)